jgi:hypothetical protein
LRRFLPLADAIRRLGSVCVIQHFFPAHDPCDPDPEGKLAMFKMTMMSSAALVLAGSVALADTAVRSDFPFTSHAVPIGKSVSFLPSVTPNLYPLSAQFGNLPPKDVNGNDYWPCYTGGSNSDCSSIPNGGVVGGIPVYAWPLSACDNNSSPATPCGQIYFFYQDLTGDTTDDLILTVTVKQGTNFIFAKGPENLGPNPYLNEVVVFAGDKAFGTQGQFGKGNGWCAGSKLTCVDPVQGLATGSVTIQVGPYKMHQTFKIWLQ